MKYSFRYFVDLTLILTFKEFKCKYKSTTLGMAWLLVNPLLQMLVLTVVFSVFFRINIPHYPLYVLSGLLPWTFFYNGTLAGTSSIIVNRELIKKVPFPRILLPFSAVCAQMIPVIFAIGFLTIVSSFMFGLQIKFIFIPLLLILEMILILGIAFALSSLDVYYRDVSFMLQALLFVWFYLNPIFYSLTFVPQAFQGYYILNPFVGVATSFQALILPSEQLHLPALTVSIGETLIIGFLGIWLFKKREKYFADWV